MGSEAKFLLIRSGAAVPEAGDVVASRSQIQKWLNDTAPTAVNDAGFAYGHAASTVDLACGAIQRVAKELAQVWGGDAAVEVQKAMQLLHATGTELSSKMEMMSTALRLYGETYLPEARAKTAGLAPDIGLIELPGTATESKDTKTARKVMRELNEKIVELYTIQVPLYVSYELPTVSLPGGTSEYKNVDYGGGPAYKDGSPGSGSQGTGGGGSSSRPGGSGGSGGSGSSGGGGTGGTGSDSSGANGPGSVGSGANGPGSGDPVGSSGPGQDGSGANGPGANGPGSTDPGANGPGADGSGGQGSGGPGSDGGTGKDGDGTVSPVIGGDERHDPRSTETASATQRPPTNLVSPPNTVGPTTNLPHITTSVPNVSPVLGGPGAGTGFPGAGSGAGGATSPVLSRGVMSNGASMAPFMPGMGGATGEKQEDRPRGPGLEEIHNVWGGGQGGTPPLLC
ncbi:uncharacterized protein YukE [Streptosporangium album]|uniref:Uncharacterized protein YukE n=1 Tax=Streptosporangium album TaxID=47479 RepID=A0A7W7RS11_9ACTN|nr:hypothetical protein [Streptosporangium album]MBB4937134.1 uncharacterized protein YukE [Streptosporangium album]